MPEKLYISFSVRSCKNCFSRKYIKTKSVFKVSLSPGQSHLVLISCKKVSLSVRYYLDWTKKVLLPECKMHRAHCAASTHCAPLLFRGGGAGRYLPWLGRPTLAGGTSLVGGYLPCWLEGGYHPPIGRKIGTPSPIGWKEGTPPISCKVGTPPPGADRGHLWKQYLPPSFGSGR